MKSQPDRYKLAMRLAISGMLTALTLSCSGGPPLTPQYELSACRKVALVDALTGWEITGAEDLAIDRKERRVLISAYDRQAVERAVRRKADELPVGGLYSVSVSELFDESKSPIELASMVTAPKTASLRPHGIFWNEDSHELFFINRRYERERGVWRLHPELMLVSASGELSTQTAAIACSANSVLVNEASTLISLTHPHCGWRAGLANLRASKNSGVWSADGDPLFAHVAYANGLSESANGVIALATTRERAIVFLKSNGKILEEVRRVRLPGGPDNLSVGLNGDLVAALHPSLFSLMLERKFGIGRAPSRIVSIDSAGDLTLLVEDKNADIISAASIAIEVDEGIIIGSASDNGIAVCEKASAWQ